LQKLQSLELNDNLFSLFTDAFFDNMKALKGKWSIFLNMTEKIKNIDIIAG
jgi:hypothetical protein